MQTIFILQNGFAATAKRLLPSVRRDPARGAGFRARFTVARCPCFAQQSATVGVAVSRCRSGDPTQKEQHRAVAVVVPVGFSGFSWCGLPVGLAVSGGSGRGRGRCRWGRFPSPSPYNSRGTSLKMRLTGGFSQ
jgi:hypothetical protein